MREERTANASSNFGKQNVESIDEFDAETVELFFVPFVRFANFLYRAIRNPQPVRHVPRKIRSRDGFRHGGDAVPDQLDQADTLGDGQFKNLGDGKLTHVS